MPDLKAGQGKRPLGGLFIALGVIAVLMAILFFMSCAVSRSGTMHFQYEGREVQGQVETLALSSTHVLTIGYSYADDFGNTHHASDIYPLADADSIKAGQALYIIYLAPRPEVSRIAAHQLFLMNTIRMPWDMIGYIAAGGILSMAYGVRRRRREHKR